MLYQKLIDKKLIDKGWSVDKKYLAVTAQGERYLLRISPEELYERRKEQFAHMQTIAEQGIPMCRPLEFGTCEEGVYSIQTWIDGEDAEQALSAMDEASQYRYGLDAGKILAKIHSIPAPRDAQDWAERFNAKIDRKLHQYAACELKYDGGDHLIAYIQRSRHQLAMRPQSYQHGDYHVGNMMIDKQGVLTIIDFEKDDFGDPWEEFNRIVWSVQAAPAFASGLVQGYFEGDIPELFWELLALYICSNTLSSLPWAIPFGEEEVEVMRRQAAQVLRWYDDMQCTVPTWFKRL